MSKGDWLLACVVAMGVAVITVAMIAPPMVWAGDTATVPALPPAGLMIPSKKAHVSATATPHRGWPVKVLLTLKAPSAQQGLVVPVTLTVYKTTMDPGDRGMPPAEQVAKADASLRVGAGGVGSATVKLPLKWGAQPAAQTSSRNNGTRPVAYSVASVTTYSMVLTSSLGGQAEPDNLDLAASMPVPQPAPVVRSVNASQRVQNNASAKKADMAKTPTQTLVVADAPIQQTVSVKKADPITTSPDSPVVTAVSLPSSANALPPTPTVALASAWSSTSWLSASFNTMPLFASVFSFPDTLSYQTAGRYSAAVRLSQVPSWPWWAKSS